MESSITGDHQGADAVIDLVIPPEHVETKAYYLKYREGFRLHGFLKITEYVHPPAWQKWDLPPYNHLFTIAHKAVVRDVGEVFVVPIFVNDEVQLDVCFDEELPGVHLHPEYREKIAALNKAYPAIAFFKGNDDWHYALRFKTYLERFEMLFNFGEELGFNRTMLIGHN